MKIFLLLLIGLCIAEAGLPKSLVNKEWNKFKRGYGRRFKNAKETYFRKVVFQKKLEQIEEHNKRYHQGLESYEIGVNQFSDYTEEEMLKYTNGLQRPSQEPKPLIEITEKSFSFARAALPGSLDWRSLGKVTPVKDQKRCGSCWAFATTGALESHFLIRYGYNVSLSEQQLVDCVPEAHGCNGGWMHYAYRYIANNGGINYDRHYPYQASDNQCRYNAFKSKVKLRGYALLSRSDEYDLKRIVATIGPVSVAFDASGNFGYYTRGVYYNAWCQTDKFTHAVVIVGYGTENGQEYWLVKNSWGSRWGLNGYFKIARNRNNHCGIGYYASYPVF